MTPYQIQTIQKIAKRIAPKFSFGYYDAEDIEQECFILAYEALEKYDPKLGTLYNFLYTHLTNRLKNIWRKKYFRQLKRCKKCEHEEELCDLCQQRQWRFMTKKNLMNPIDISNVNCNNEPNTYTSYDMLEKIELEDIFLIINRELEIHLRRDYLKMLEGLSIPKVKRDIIENRILEILENHGYGEQAWAVV
jgi:hypothetical protein